MLDSNQRRLTAALLRLGHELEGDRVHAVPGVLGGEPFTDEDVAEVTAAARALYFDTIAIRIREPPDGALDLLVERRPAASGVELRIRNVEGRVASSTDVRALDEEIVVFARKWALGPFVHDDTRLFRGELVQRSHNLIIAAA
jgi:hypothetical protein